MIAIKLVMNIKPFLYLLSHRGFCSSVGKKSKGVSIKTPFDPKTATVEQSIKRLRLIHKSLKDKDGSTGLKCQEAIEYLKTLLPTPPNKEDQIDEILSFHLKNKKS